MKQSIIYDILNGDRANFESRPTSKQYQKLMGNIADACATFDETLNDEQKEQLQKITDISGEMEYLSVYESFAEGMKIGMRLGFEACSD